MNPNHVPSWPETVERDAHVDRAARRDRWINLIGAVVVVLIGMAVTAVGLYGLGARW